MSDRRPPGRRFSVWKTLPVLFFLLSAPFLPAEIEQHVAGRQGWNFYVKQLYNGVRGETGTITRYVSTGNPGEFSVTERSGSGTGLQLVPSFSGASALRAGLREYNPDKFVELLFDMPPLSASGDGALLYILNRLTAMETMEGITYYSSRERRLTRYIDRCFFTDGANSRNRVAEPEFASLPDSVQTYTLFQDDNRFTPIWYRVDVRAYDDAIRITMTNLTPVFVQFLFYFKALGREQMRHEIVIQPNSSGLKIYALSQVHSTIESVMGIRFDLANSFNNRMSGLQGWMATQLY